VANQFALHNGHQRYLWIRRLPQHIHQIGLKRSVKRSTYDVMDHSPIGGFFRPNVDQSRVLTPNTKISGAP